MLLPYVCAIIILIIDQSVKYWTVINMQLNESITLVDGLIDLFYLHNYGAGWGLFSGRIVFFIIITLLVVLYIIFLIYRNRHLTWLTRVSYGLLLGGAIGNLIDRLRLGYVIDMFRFTFIDFPVFNIADASLTIGVFLLIIIIVFNLEKEEVI